MSTATPAANTAPRDSAGRRLNDRARVHRVEGVPSPLTRAEVTALAAYRSLLDEADGETPTLAAVAGRAGMPHGSTSKALCMLRRLGADIPSLRTPPPGSPEVAVTPGEVAARKFAIRAARLAELGHREPPDDDGGASLRSVCRGYVREHRRILERWGWIGAPKRKELAA